MKLELQLELEFLCAIAISRLPTLSDFALYLGLVVVLLGRGGDPVLLLNLLLNLLEGRRPRRRVHFCLLLLFIIGLVFVVVAVLLVLAIVIAVVLKVINIRLGS